MNVISYTKNQLYMWGSEFIPNIWFVIYFIYHIFILGVLGTLTFDVCSSSSMTSVFSHGLSGLRNPLKSTEIHKFATAYRTSWASTSPPWWWYLPGIQSCRRPPKVKSYPLWDLRCGEFRLQLFSELVPQLVCMFHVKVGRIVFAPSSHVQSSCRRRQQQKSWHFQGKWLRFWLFTSGYIRFMWLWRIIRP